MSFLTRPLPDAVTTAIWRALYLLVAALALLDGYYNQGQGGIETGAWMLVAFVAWHGLGPVRRRRAAQGLADWLVRTFGPALALVVRAGNLAVMVAAPFAILYFLVRFVKWAWTD